jgi:hypothetical protein
LTTPNLFTFELRVERVSESHFCFWFS